MNRKIISLILLIIASSVFAELSCGFIIDLTPPFVLPDGLYPPPETTLAETDVTMDIDIDDGIAGVWDDSVRIVVSVNGFPTDSIIGATSFPQSFSSGDTVDVCIRAIDEIYDTLWCTCPANELDSCWRFYILECDTFMVEHICPNPCDITTSCDDQFASMRLYPASSPGDLAVFAIDEIIAVIERSSAPTETLYAAPRLSVIGDTVQVLAPFSGYSNGDTVKVFIHSRNECPVVLSDTCQFIVDLQPPVLVDYFPPEDTTIGLSSPSIIINLFDSLAGVLPESTIIRSIANHSDGTADTVLWYGSGVMVGDYQPLDTVQICILQAMDNIDYYEGCTCPPNVMDTTCWEFNVFYCVAGPFAEVVYPDSCGYITSCNDQEIHWEIFDTTGLTIDDTTIQIHVSIRGPSGALDTNITTFSATLSWDGISNLYFQPGVDGWFWNSGDTVTVSLIGANNTGGCPLDSPAECSFIVDLDPPVAYDFEPPLGDVVSSMNPFVNASYIDSICSLYDATASWSLFRSGMLIDGPTSFMLGSSISISSPETGDSVVVCLDLADYPDFDYCPPNDTTICWWFTLSLDAPTAWIIEPLDLDGDSVVTSACDCQPIIIGISDSDGIDESTIQLDIEGTIYDTDDPELVWDGDTMLTFTPTTPCWSDGDVVDFELIAAEDSLGTPLGAPLAGSFIPDYSPPVMVGTYPPEGSVIPGPWGDITYAIFEDIPSGLDSLFPSIGYVFDDGLMILNQAVIWQGDTALIPGTDTLAIDGTIDICFEEIQDSPDYCLNSVDTCFSFEVVTGEPAAVWVLPIDENADGDTITACDCQEIVFEITTTYGLFPESTLVRINSVDYPYDPAWMTFTADHDSLILDPLPICPFSDGDVVDVELVMLVDSTLGHLVTPLSGSFHVDLAGPEFTGAYPTSPVSGIETDVYISASDVVCGDVIADSIVIFDDLGGVFDFVYDTLSLSLSGLTGGTYTACVYAHDDCADYCGPNYADSCWEFEVMIGEPAANWVEPIDINLDGDTISACSCQVVIFEITTTYGLFPESTIVRVDGIPYSWDPSWMTLTDDHDSLIIDPLPVCPHTHGALVTAAVIEMVDSTGGHLVETESGSFRIDLRGPTFSGAFPTGIYSLPDVNIRINSSDDICPDVVADSIVVSIGGSPVASAVDTLGIAYSGLADDDVVTVCAFVHDNCADYCGSNYSDTCWSFDVTLGAISASVIYPEDTDGDGLVVTGCQGPPIYWLIFSDYDIVPESTWIFIEGIPFDLSSDGLSASAGFDTLFWNADSSIWYSDSQVINHELFRLFDVTGESLAPSVVDSFLIDISPPALLDRWPYPSTYTLDPVFGFFVIDTVYRIDYDDFLVTFETPTRTDEFDVSSPYAEWSGDSLIIDYLAYPEAFSWGDSVLVCLHLHDCVDVCEPNYLDTCWIVVIQDTFPPYADSWTWSSGCDDQAVPWLVFDDHVGVDTTRFDVTIDGAGWSLTDPEVSFAGPETLYYQPSIPWTEGIHTGCVAGLWDWHNNPIDSAYCYDFLIDLTPPEIVFLTPSCSTEVHDTLAEITFTVSDSLSPLNPDSCWIVVRGDTFMLDSLSASGDTFTFDPATEGWVWAVDETVVYCVHASDMPTYCSNTDERCCEFYILQSTLWAELLHPPNVFTSCSLQTVSWLFHGLIDTTSAIVVLGDTNIFDMTDPELYFNGDTLFFEPTSTWLDSQFVHLCLVYAEDTFGVVLDDTICSDFGVDLTSPVFYGLDPAPGEEVDITSPIISLSIYDDLSGLDPFSIIMTVNGETVGPTLIDDSLSFNPSDSGWTWSGGDTITVCIWAADNAQFCGANADSICYEFAIASGGPEITPIIPPAESLWSACNDQGAMFTILDPDSVDSSSIIVTVNGDTITSWAFSNDTLQYSTPASWNDGDTITVCVWAEDMLGNPCDDWGCITYFIDLEAPVISNIDPTPETSIAATPTFDIIVADSGSGIDGSSVTISLDGNTYVPGDGFLTFDGVTITLDPDTTFAQGDTLTLCIDSLIDSPDLCLPNQLDSCWIYVVEVLPDMWTDDSMVMIDPASIVEGDTITFTGTMFQEYSYADFSWDIVANGITIMDSFAVLNAGELMTVVRDFYGVFVELGPGDYVLCMRLDPEDYWAEWNEDNNIGCTNLSIISSECDAHPSPFSPNGDGVNDYAIFNYPGQAAMDAVIKIYDMEGQQVRELKNANIWDGADGAGQPLPRDIYMYLVIRDDEIICKGTIYLAR